MKKHIKRLVSAILTLVMVVCLLPVFELATKADYINMEQFTKEVALNVNVYFQTRNDTCSAAATLMVLRYFNKAYDVVDTDLKQSGETAYVGKIVNNLKRYGEESYKYIAVAANNEEQYFNTIKESLTAGNPLIARIRINDGDETYFNYSPPGHFTVIVGLYKYGKEYWVELRDSWINRYKMTTPYCDRDTGRVMVPLDELFKYGTFYGSQKGYLIYSTQVRCSYAQTHNGMHDWNNYVCKDCNYWEESQIQSTPVPQGSRSYRVLPGSSAALRSGPYNECSSMSLAGGTRITVVEEIINKRGMTWYKIEGLSGYSGYNYIYSERVEKVAETTPDSELKITLKDMKNKTISITEGNACPVHGVISTNGKLTAVTATLDGKRYVFYSSILPNTTRFENTNYLDIGKSRINKDLIGSKLSVGTHSLVIMATDNYGGSKTETITITVNANPKIKLSKPTVNVSNWLGVGKKVVIKQNPSNPSGTKLVYRINSGAEVVTEEAEVILHFLKSARITAYATRYGKNSASASGPKLASRSGVGEDEEMNDSDVEDKYIEVLQLEEPTIEITPNATGAVINLASEEGAELYYSINGGEEQRYLQPFNLTANATLTAVAVRPGYASSEIASMRVDMSAPEPPAVSLLGTGSRLAQESVAMLSWKAIGNAAVYTLNVSLDGTLIDTIEYITDTVFPYVLQETGEYSFTVSASNRFGTSDESDTVIVTAVAPLSVRFVDWDGAVLSEQSVPYGADAVEPADPQREGYDFLYWNGDTKGITEDMTITPEYRIRTFRVDIVDQTGKLIETVRRVPYLNDVELPDTGSLILENGYCFMGWSVQPEASSSVCWLDTNEGKLKDVDSNVTVRAITGWAELELPVAVEIVKAERNDDAAKNYEVVVRLNSNPSQYTTALVRVSLKTAEGKMVRTEAHTIGLPADTVGKEERFTLNYNGTATIAEAIVLGYEGDNGTGSAYSQAVTENVAVVSDWTYSPWTDWSSIPPEDIDSRTEGVNLETKVQYRQRTKSTNTSKSNSGTPPALEGWTYYKTTSEWTTGSWSSWSDSPYYATTTDSYIREVEPSPPVYVKTQYQYYHYRNPSTGDESPIKKTSGHVGPHYYTDSSGNTWIDTPLPPAMRDGQQRESTDQPGTLIWWGYCASCGGTSQKHNFYLKEQRDVYKTQYRYRDKTRVYTHSYYKWSEWSAWQDAVITNNDPEAVNTRTVYRYRNKDVPQTTPLVGNEDNSGEVYSISGVLPVGSETDLSGKRAVVMVYKGRNTDPNESQLEYVGQTVIGSGNTYSFSFKTREEPSVETGDFVVSLSLEGATGLVNVDTIFAPRRQYYVQFTDRDGTPISVYDGDTKVTQAVYDEDGNLLYGEAQIVEEGCNPVIPPAPELDGYYFTTWSANTTYIAEDSVFLPLYERKTFVSVYVDWVNESINVYEYDLGNEAEAPSVEERNGYTFLGWEEDPSSGTEHVKVYFAAYEVDEFLVRFLDFEGNALDSQTVPFGSAAVPPTAPEIPNMIFLSWSTSMTWWNVMEDIDVFPIYVYEDTAETPWYEVDDFDLDDPKITLQAEEGATIYYTTDGLEPDIETAEMYTGPIPVEEGTEIRAIAVIPEKNTSEILEVYFEFGSDDVYIEDLPDIVEIGTYAVNAEPGGSVAIQLRMSEDAGLVAYLFTVECDRSVFYVDYDEETGLVAMPGEASPDGFLFCAPLDDYGYQILWFSDEDGTTAGDLFTIVLHASDESEAGTYSIRVGYSPANTVTADDVEASADSMSVFLGGSNLLGDVSGDGYVTTVDVVRIARYLIDDFALTQAQIRMADVTGDGTITAADLIRLARYLVGMAELG